jgi:hypothetical protein
MKCIIIDRNYGEVSRNTVGIMKIRSLNNGGI